MTFSLQFLGAIGTVTGSRYLVTSGASRLLIDCGLFQGYKQLRLRNWAPLPFKPRELAAVVLTHAHIDHSGYLPLLVKHGYQGPIYCTPATADLCRIMLPDAGRLQEEEAEHANRHDWSKHKPAQPLYNEADAVAALKQLAPQLAGVEFEAADCQLTLRPAGHILGAAGVLVRGQRGSVYLSGDVGRLHDPIMRAPEAPPLADFVVMESTYGNRLHEVGEPFEKLGEVIRRTSERHGVVVIPAFAVGRTQTLLYGIHSLKRTGCIPRELPIYLNSPMAIDTTALYRKHHSEHRLDAEQCAGMCGAAHLVNTSDESRNLNKLTGPMVIIAGSGMATGGRVVHHLKAFAPDARNSILLAGFQAGGTRGAALAAGADSIKIHGAYVVVRAEVASLNNLSAHADQAELLAWLRQIPKAPQRVFVTHGEPDAADAMRRHVEEKLGWSSIVPEYGQTVMLDSTPG
jgi:metallo-beta-lactamase family protein